MALMIIVTIIALAALVVAIIANARLTEELERLADEVKALGVAVKILQDTVDSEDKGISVAGLEAMSYDPKTDTMAIKANLVVKGSVVAGGNIEEV